VFVQSCINCVLNCLFSYSAIHPQVCHKNQRAIDGHTNATDGRIDIDNVTKKLPSYM